MRRQRESNSIRFSTVKKVGTTSFGGKKTSLHGVAQDAPIGKERKTRVSKKIKRKGSLWGGRMSSCWARIRKSSPGQKRKKKKEGRQLASLTWRDAKGKNTDRGKGICPSDAIQIRNCRHVDLERTRTQKHPGKRLLATAICLSEGETKLKNADRRTVRLW